MKRKCNVCGLRLLPGEDSICESCQESKNFHSLIKKRKVKIKYNSIKKTLNRSKDDGYGYYY